MEKQDVLAIINRVVNNPCLMENAVIASQIVQEVDINWEITSKSLNIVLHAQSPFYRFEVIVAIPRIQAKLYSLASTREALLSEAYRDLGYGDPLNYFSIYVDGLYSSNTTVGSVEDFFRKRAELVAEGIEGVKGFLKSNIVYSSSSPEEFIKAVKGENNGRD